MPSIIEIQVRTAEHFGIPFREMTSARRSRHIVRPRQIAMYLAKELTGRSYPEIGRMFGHRDHTTILHGARLIAELQSTDPEIKMAVDLLRIQLAERTSPDAAPITYPMRFRAQR
jgi:chromosomal replication initiator protein